MRDRYGIHDDVELGEEDVRLSSEMWEIQRENRGLPLGEVNEAESSVRAVNGTPKLRGKGAIQGGEDGGGLGKLLRKTTARRYDPWADAGEALFSTTTNTQQRTPKDPDKSAKRIVGASHRPDTAPAGGIAVLAGYGSD